MWAGLTQLQHLTYVGGEDDEYSAAGFVQRSPIQAHQYTFSTSPLDKKQNTFLLTP